MRMHRTLAMATFLLSSIVQPAAFAGCGSDAEPSFDYGAAEMSGLLDAANEHGSWFFQSEGHDYRVDLELRALATTPSGQRARNSVINGMLVRKARACGPETRWVSTAAACDTVYYTKLAVAGVASVVRLAEDGEQTVARHDVAGELEVPGRIFATAPNIRVKLQGSSMRVVLKGMTVADDFDLELLTDESIDIAYPNPR